MFLHASQSDAGCSQTLLYALAFLSASLRLPLKRLRDCTEEDCVARNHHTAPISEYESPPSGQGDQPIKVDTLIVILMSDHDQSRYKLSERIIGLCKSVINLLVKSIMCDKQTYLRHFTLDVDRW